MNFCDPIIVPSAKYLPGKHRHTRTLLHPRIRWWSVLLRCIRYIFDGVGQRTVFVRECVWRALGKRIIIRLGDPDIKCTLSGFGCDILYDGEADGQFHDILYFLAFLPRLLRGSIQILVASSWAANVTFWLRFFFSSDKLLICREAALYFCVTSAITCFAGQSVCLVSQSDWCNRSLLFLVLPILFQASYLCGIAALYRTELFKKALRFDLFLGQQVCQRVVRYGQF